VHLKNDRLDCFVIFSTKMRILGIDPGYGLCGFAILDSVGENVKLGNFGVIRTKTQTDFSERLLEIGEDFQSLLEKYRPEIVAIEGMFFAQNISTGIDVAQSRGMMVFLAKKFGCKLVEPKPAEIKKCFTGNGKSGKSEIKKMARMIFNLKDSPKIDDSADAIAVGFFATRLQNQFRVKI